MSEKPYKGEIISWTKMSIETPNPPGLGYFIIGRFVNHPEFGMERGYTSYVVKHDAVTGEIETKNSRYTLV